MCFNFFVTVETLDHRQGRSALHTEPLTSKAKREQDLRNILAARRRRLNLRPEASRRSVTTTKTPRPVTNVTKDPLDMFEAQETRHGVYVTAPAGDQASIVVVDDDDDVESPSSKSLDKSHETTVTEVANDSIIVVRREPTMLKNSRTQKSPDDTLRRKNTVAMPESLYNHFRPVESNIPMEDMTQFLYFGQKIQPENTTNNNTVEVTSVSPTAYNSRRRFFHKTTTILPIIKLEDIMNDEMNIALEKSIVEKNKIPKTKNVFRNTNFYTRKSASQVRASDPTIASNVIVTNRSSDPSAHATDQMEDHLRGSPTHRINVSTQILGEHQRNDVGGRGNESEMRYSNVVSTTSTNDYQLDTTFMPVKSEKPAKTLQRKKNHSISRIDRLNEEMDSTAKDQRPEATIKTTFESITLSTTENIKTPSRISASLSINTDTTTDQRINKTVINTTTTTTTINPIYPHSSLRIVVTEPVMGSAQDQNYQSTVRPGNSSNIETLSTTVAITPFYYSSSSSATAYPTTTPAIPLKTNTPAVQQMHPYAYTITNVTRLLGNYSGPGSNDRTTTTEAFPPLSAAAALEALEPARTPDPVSVGPTVAETTAASSSPFLVGERGRKGTSLRVVEHNQSVDLNLTVAAVSINETAKPLRWNHTRIDINNNDKDIISERRYLRKSASAVLNQRVGDESIRDFKRRRIDTTNRRVKGPRGEDRVSGSRSIDAAGEHAVIESLGNKTVNIDTMDKPVENATLSTDTTDVTKMIDELTQQNKSVIINDDDDSSNFTTNVNNVDKNMVKLTEEIINETMPLTTTIKILTTARPAPVFPVTPIMLDSTNKVTKEDEIHEAEGPKIPDRPFGIAEDLDPSEIQKMYRATVTLKPEATMTTLPTEVKTLEPKKETTRRPTAGERSPEVRARNLSDKTKDKDDVLPIMHLYNTSNIFNGTMNEQDERVMGVGVKPKVEGTTQVVGKNNSEDTRSDRRDQVPDATEGRTTGGTKSHKNRHEFIRDGNITSTSVNKTRHRTIYYSGPMDNIGYHPEVNRSIFEPGMIALSPRESINISEVITKRHDGDTLATQETVAVVSYILATLVVFPIAVGVGLILRRLIIRNRKVRI